MNLKNIENFEELEVGMKVWDEYGFEKKILEKLTNTVLLSHDNDREVAGEWRAIKELKTENFKIELQEWKPKEGEEYFYPSVDYPYSFDTSIWTDTPTDQFRLQNNLIFKTEEEAKARREEILKLSKK